MRYNYSTLYDACVSAIRLDPATDNMTLEGRRIPFANVGQMFRDKAVVNAPDGETFRTMHRKASQQAQGLSRQLP